MTFQPEDNQPYYKRLWQQRNALKYGNPRLSPLERENQRREVESRMRLVQQQVHHDIDLMVEEYGVDALIDFIHTYHMPEGVQPFQLKNKKASHELNGLVDLAKIEREYALYRKPPTPPNQTGW